MMVIASPAYENDIDTTNGLIVASANYRDQERFLRVILRNGEVVLM